MLHGRNALVTGATSGIGLAIADTLARSGANVMINGLGDPVANRALCHELANRHGVRIGLNAADLRDPAQIETLFAQAHAELGDIDILVNNAGIQHVSPVEDFPVEKWNDILALNLTAAFHTTRLAVPQMKARGWGRIVNIGSAHALIASPFKSAYVAAKHGLNGFTKSVALELAQHGVTANTVCPGYVLTPLVEKQIPDTMKARGLTEEQVIHDVLLAAQPTRKFVSVQEIAEAVLYLCSEGARSITGTSLSIDGGWTTQ
ncbi:3-hydroxybutyrate dehydrogenase [Uliginosibacterium sp. 31-16]|uniref:3-hydroxybutyrate dehydrogenase n=1 Tax=Uliginosibacterium sp. 31-16 TaxID=3068315 RepID=UPI0027401D97|nr:3-hydroxybutyrate dehydrogenase [Uliginosibacterium sp. 31-16]MDP5238467.1 3-hydroxybutyrate dehydrogenase [Uliginosibacterium sp. 31-16]